MRLADVKATLRQRLATDAAIETFCRENFFRSLNVLRRFDKHGPPKEPDCPWAHLEFVRDRKSNVSREQERTFVLTCGIWLDPEGGREDGEDLASTLRELIEAALFKPGLGKVDTGEDVYEEAEDGFFENISTLIFTTK